MIGMKQSRNNVKAQKLIPIIYHLCKLSVRSVNGAQINRQIFADKPSAVMEAADATENPCCINIKGKVTDAKPVLMPNGSTKKRTVTGSVLMRLFVN